jgi:hypothetical protein
MKILLILGVFTTISWWYFNFFIELESNPLLLLVNIILLIWLMVLAVLDKIEEKIKGE